LSDFAKSYCTVLLLQHPAHRKVHSLKYEELQMSLLYFDQMKFLKAFQAQYMHVH